MKIINDFFMFERRHPVGTLLTITIFFGVIFWFAGGSRVKDLAPYYIKKIIGETAEVSIKGTVFKVEVARTVNSRTKGLSGREYLEGDKGMLFVFQESSVYPFTMKKTKITLDIIWILDNEIGYIANKAQPGQISINPGVEANYVLEVRGGTAETLRWQIGDSVDITFDKNK